MAAAGVLFLIEGGSNLRVTNPEQQPHFKDSCPDWGQICDVWRYGCYLRDKVCAPCGNGSA